jgi:ribosomal protein L37E
MNRPYRWRCFACDKANEARATSCATCGFPASASGTEIAKAQAAWRAGEAGARIPYSPPAAPVARQHAKWSGSRKGVAIAGIVLLAITAYALTGSLSWPRLGVSLFACMFGALLLLVACTPRDRALG